jgi:putative flippase GtrA
MAVAPKRVPGSGAPGTAPVSRPFNRIRTAWATFAARRPSTAQFLVFFVLSNGITLLQLIMMPAFRALLGLTDLVDVSFQVFPVGSQVDGSPYYIFDYAAGGLPEGGGGLSYFLAVQITLAIAQIINFFAQRNITFKSNTSAWRAAFWYTLAYIVITFAAAALQGFYKAPIYDLLITTWGMGDLGETIADVITTIINAAISFWVFFPIFKVIFRRTPKEADAPAGATSA